MSENNINYPKFKVCVRCFTFNQAKYITDALNGFTMQQTDFPFVCCIVDDASTDGEQEVIRKYVEENFDFSEGSVSFHKETDYAHITYARHNTNKNCYFAVLYLKENHYSQRKDKMPYLSEWRDNTEYEALCEGDDYWIASEKLQKQVVFLENNHDYGFCASRAYYYSELTKKIRICGVRNRELTFDSVLISGGIGTATCTIMYRLQSIEGYRDFIGTHRWPLGDLPLFLYILSKSKGMVLETPLATYRILEESASHFKFYEGAKDFQDSVRSIQLFFAKTYAKTAISHIEDNNYTKQFYIALSYGKTKKAIKYAKHIKLSTKDFLRIIKSVFICQK